MREFRARAGKLMSLSRFLSPLRYSLPMSSWSLKHVDCTRFLSSHVAGEIVNNQSWSTVLFRSCASEANFVHAGCYAVHISKLPDLVNARA